MRSRVWLTVLLAVSVVRHHAIGKDVSEIPFRFADGLIWVDVAVRQRAEPLHFLLDSGANVSVINITAAKKLRAKLGNKVTVQGVKSEVVGFWRTRLSVSA